MNTIGKILVILNLVFAVVVAGFLVIDFATRTNWKNAYEAMKREADVHKSNNNVSGKTITDSNNHANRMKAEAESAKQQLADQQTIFKSREENMQTSILDAVERAKNADLN